jgi:hypothetical protein
MDREVFEILVNDESQGVLTEKLPRPMFFVVDMGWSQLSRFASLFLGELARCFLLPCV